MVIEKQNLHINLKSRVSMSHDFNIRGGDILRHVDASFFISYLYHFKIDENHCNYLIVLREVPNWRTNRIDNNEEFHKDWINKIINMNPSKLSNNKIGLSGLQVISMAKELKSYYKF